MSTKKIIGIVIVIVAIVSAIIYVRTTNEDSSLAKNGKETNSQSGNNTSLKPLFTEHITPCEVIENGEFYLESDDPIAQKFLGIPDTITYSGKGKSWVPSGRWKGPIKFWDPKNPKTGNKSFRIYPVK